jgi:hypothetical protein
MDNDPYALCYEVEKHAAKAFNKAGLAAFERQIRARFEAASTATPTPGKSAIHDEEYLRRRGSEILRTIYLVRRNLAAYLAHATQTGITARDCRALAAMLLARRKPEEALAWVERGIALDRENPHGRTSAGYDLTRLHRELLTRLGRGNEAIEAAWAEFRKDPGKYSYDELMKFVPRTGRAAWHEKAMDAAKGDDLRSLIELFIGDETSRGVGARRHGPNPRAFEPLRHRAGREETGEG